MLNITLQTLLLTAVQVIIVKLLVDKFNNLDNEVDLAFKVNDIITLVIISFLCNLEISALWSNKLHIIQLWVTTLYLLIQGYTDSKTKQVYSIINYITLGLNIILLIISCIKFKLLIPLPIFIVLFVLFVICILRGIGAGDIFVYVIIAINYLIFKAEFSYIIIALNLLLSQVLFIIFNIKIFIKNKKEKRALIPYILLAWVLLLPTLA